jgi:hemolysin
MTRNPLFLAIATGVMLATLPTAFAYSGAFDRPTTGSVAEPTAAPVRMEAEPVRLLTLAEVSDAFRHGMIAPQSWPGRPASRGATLADQLEVAARDDVLIAWVSTESMADPSSRAQLRALYDAGVPVLVTRQPGVSDEAATAVGAVFGATSLAPIAYYYRRDDARTRILSIPETNNAALPAVLSLVNAELVRELRAPEAVVADVPVELPRHGITDTAFGSNGSSVTQEIDVVRDSTISRDNKQVIAKSSYNLVPYENGWNNRTLVIPRTYAMTQTLRVGSVDNGSGGVIRPVLLKQYPTSNGSTDITFGETQTTTTSYGFNISRDMEGGVKGLVPEASAKTSFGFTFGKEYKTEKSFSMTVKDYRVASSAGNPSPLVVDAGWNLELADVVRSSDKYFGDPPTTEKVSPMMRQASAQTYALWQVPGAYDEDFVVSATSRVTNVRYDGKSRRDQVDTGAMPTSIVVVPRKSPFLTREITVLLQNQAGAGLCMGANLVGGQEVYLATCPADVLEQRNLQWNLDAEGRYRNRTNNQCLDLDPSSGQVRTAPCSLVQNQRWEWHTDGIYSLYNGGSEGWRLYVKDGKVKGKTDPAVHPIRPNNPFHILFRPWSTYPLAPIRGAVVPNFPGSLSPPIPEDWVGKYGAVSSDELWRVTVLRQGL